jgi:ZIP family zinc transporter
VSEILQVILFTTLAGAAIPIGGAIASVEHIRPRWLEQELRHSVIAFGGGVLLSAVALVLVPEGVKGLALPAIIGAMMLGAMAFMGIDIALARSQTSASQLAAMLADFIPEAVALGAGFATGGSVGVLLALLIAMQNLPEGFNAYREIFASGRWKRLRLLLLFVALVPLGPLAGICGHQFLAAYPPAVNAIMLFASGGILYLTFEDIAPQAKLERAWAPPVGAVVGFLTGVIGHQLIG